jgi:predicted kinase
MKRFSQEALLDRLGAEGWGDTALMERLARVIRGFHETAARTPEAGWLAALDRIAGTLEETLLGDGAAALDLSGAPYLSALRQDLRERAPLLRERLAEGYVRRCHGDLHLRNIVLLDGQPVLFDAIEFDEELATIDVLYDLAFLLMDLWHRGARMGANMVLSAYLQGDVSAREMAGLRLLPLFMSLRAAIRAMVGVHALPVTLAGRRAEAEQGIRAYARLAAGLLAPRGPALVCIGGLSGTGKTTVSRGLAPEIGAAPGAVHLRSDVERKLMFGVTPTAPLPADAYGAEVSARVYARLLDKAVAILRAGHAVVLDVGFRKPEQRAAAADVARQVGAPFRGLWLEADPATMIARVEQRRGDASDAGREVVLSQLAAAPASGSLSPGWTAVDANGGPDRTLAAARAACLPL